MIAHARIAVVALAILLAPRGLRATASLPQGQPGKDNAPAPGPIVDGSSKPGQFTVTELIFLANALESRGEPQRAIEVMDRFRFNFANRPEFWTRLARLYENNLEFDKALSCHEQASRINGLTVADGLRQARLMCELLRPAGALQRLLVLRGKAPETDLEYWKLLGDLAWRVENHPLATEAYALVWKHYKTQEAAERLVQALEAVGRNREAIALAEDGHRRFGASVFLESAIEIAVNAGLMDEARALFAKTRGKEAQLDLPAQFWYQRGVFAIAEDEPESAEQDLQRALSIDPGLEAAHLEWLKLAVQLQDSGMARRAMAVWSGQEHGPDQAALLAEAHALMGNRAQSRRFRRIVRTERARQPAGAEPSLDAEERLERALELGDRTLIKRTLAGDGGRLSLPLRVAALRELGLDHDAWDLVESSGLNRDGHGSTDALALGGDLRSLRENYLDGAWGWVRTDSLGQLVERNAGARFELRAGRLFLGAEAGFDRLTPPRDRTKTLPNADTERTALLTARLRERFGETGLRLGASLLPEGARLQIDLRQRLKLLNERVDVNVAGIYGEIPRHSMLLRLVGLRDGVDVDVNAAIAGPLELGGSLSYGRFNTRNGEYLTSEKAARAEVAFQLPFQDFSLRPRIDGFANQVPPLTDVIPRGLAPLLSPSDNTDDLLALQYASVGLGANLVSARGDVGEAMGPQASLRYRLDGWAGYVWPSAHPSYAFDAAVGLVFARHQELSVHGFYAADFRNATGQSYWGSSLSYTLRWFR